MCFSLFHCFIVLFVSLFHCFIVSLFLCFFASLRMSSLLFNVNKGGDDFKSGQTKMKSVLVDFLVSSGIKPVSIVSYNHLGNNDGKNLSAPKQFRSKEISKSNVVDDMVASNGIMYDLKNNEHPDHTVVIKYVPYVRDSKRALDEYTSEIFLGGKNTISMHNTCEDSLLAAPLILDLIILAELSERIRVKKVVTISGSDTTPYERFHPVLSLLSFLLKAPLVPKGVPVVNALFPQRQAITNIMRACLGECGSTCFGVCVWGKKRKEKNGGCHSCCDCFFYERSF